MQFTLEKTNQSKIKNDLIWNYLSIVFLGISGIGINSLISIFYETSILGAFNQVLVTYLLASIFGSGGINFSVLKAIAQNNKNKNEISSIIKGALISTFIGKQEEITIRNSIDQLERETKSQEKIISDEFSLTKENKNHEVTPLSHG